MFPHERFVGAEHFQPRYGHHRNTGLSEKVTTYFSTIQSDNVDNDGAGVGHFGAFAKTTKH